MSEKEKDRIVKLPDGVEVYIRDPDRGCRERAESEKTKMWYKALSDGCLPEKKMIRFLKEKGIWDEDRESELLLLQKELIIHLQRLEEGGYSIEDAKKDAIKAHELRQEIQELSLERSNYLGQTLEAKVRNVEFEYLVSWCPVYNDTRQPYFADYNDYVTRSDSLEAILISAKAADLFYGLPDFDDTPEKRFLVENNLVDEKYRLINEDGHLIDINGKLIDEDGNYVKYEGEGRQKKAVFVDFDGNLIVKKEKKPFLDKDGKPIKPKKPKPPKSE